MERKKVLFLCTGNSCRSQMAEGWLRHLGSDRFEGLSAGTRPQPVNPLAVEVMAEVGVDISAHESKPVEPLLGRDLDVLITVCGGARESCPTFAGNVRLRRHWPLPDPAEAEGSRAHVLGVFRRVRDELRGLVEDLIDAEG